MDAVWQVPVVQSDCGLDTWNPNPNPHPEWSLTGGGHDRSATLFMLGMQRGMCLYGDMLLVYGPGCACMVMGGEVRLPTASKASMRRL